MALDSPFLKEVFMMEVNKDSFRRLRISECNNFPHVHHLIDAYVMQINRPAMFFAEAQHCFSGMYDLLFYFLLLFPFIL